MSRRARSKEMLILHSPVVFVHRPAAAHEKPVAATRTGRGTKNTHRSVSETVGMVHSLDAVSAKEAEPGEVAQAAETIFFAWCQG